MIGNMELIKLESSKKYIKFYDKIKQVIVTCGTQKISNTQEVAVDSFQKDNTVSIAKKCIMLKDDDLEDDRVADDVNYLFNHGDLPL